MTLTDHRLRKKANTGWRLTVKMLSFFFLICFLFLGVRCRWRMQRCPSRNSQKWNYIKLRSSVLSYWSLCFPDQVNFHLHLNVCHVTVSRLVMEYSDTIETIQYNNMALECHDTRKLPVGDLRATDLAKISFHERQSCVKV